MSDSPELQILAAARHSLMDKGRRFAELTPLSRQKLAAELERHLPADAGLTDFVAALPAARLPDLLASRSPTQLQLLYEIAGKVYQALKPPEQPQPTVIRLLDFAEPEDEGFTLLDFEEAEEAAAPQWQACWLLHQLIAAWYYVHHAA